MGVRIWMYGVKGTAFDNFVKATSLEEFLWFYGHLEIDGPTISFGCANDQQIAMTWAKPSIGIYQVQHGKTEPIRLKNRSAIKYPLRARWWSRAKFLKQLKRNYSPSS